MSIPICIYEDNGYSDLLPLTHTRPVYDLVSGICTLRSKIVRGFPGSALYLHCRSYLADVVAEKKAETPVNAPAGDICLFINERGPSRPAGHGIHVHMPIAFCMIDSVKNSSQ